jgi:hypothetical protein
MVCCNASAQHYAAAPGLISCSEKGEQAAEAKLPINVRVLMQTASTKMVLM